MNWLIHTSRACFLRHTTQLLGAISLTATTAFGGDCFGALHLSGTAYREQQTASRVTNAQALLDINRASSAELEKLPGIGAALARRIVEHRARYGRFRRVEHVIMVRGFSERRFKQMRHLIEVKP